MIIDSYVPGTPCWVDLMTTDMEGAIDFYGALFGWEAVETSPEYGGYAMCSLNDRMVAGIGPVQPGAPAISVWNTYFCVADADATAALVEPAGGQILAPVMAIENGDETVGRMAIFADPTGAVFGIWEPGAHQGSELANEPGAFTWNELLSTNPAVSREFLGQVFDVSWEAMDGPMEYHTATVEGRSVAGVMGLPPGSPPERPSSWNTYFAVANVTGAVEIARSAGATVFHEPFDSPFGKVAIMADPQGAAFSIIELASSPE